MWKRETCHFCHLTIAIGEAREQIGKHFFHRDETKRCFQKYLAAQHQKERALEPAKVTAPSSSRFDRR